MNYPALIKQNISIEEFIQICIESKSMGEAASKCKLNRATFDKYAKELKCHLPQKFGGNYCTYEQNVNHSKSRKINLIDIIENNLYPSYTTHNLKKRLILEELKEHKCEKCLLTEWNNLPIPIELDHIDGNKYNHLWENLRILCPNCHAQTETYRGKNNTLKYKDYIKPEKVKLNPYKALENYRINQLELKNKILLNSNIDFTKYGWGLELSKLLNITPQYSKKWIKQHHPKIWETAWKHIN